MGNISQNEFIEKKTYYESLDNLKTTYGTPYRIKEYIDRNRVIIQFTFSGIEHQTSLTRALNGKVKDPFHDVNSKFTHPFIFENKAGNFIGRHYTNNYGEKFKIIDYQNRNNVRIKFVDPPYYERKATIDDIREGAVQNPYHRNTYGGFIGEGTEYTGSEYTYLHSLWNTMLIRGNYQEHKNKSYAPNPTYENCIVSEEWKNYTNFSRDYMGRLSKLNPAFDYDMDKDLLYPFYKDKYNGLKVYSNETVVILPRGVNRWLRNVEYNTFDIKFPCNYIKQYNRYEDWINKINYYNENGAIEEIAYPLLIQVAYNALERLRNKFPEFEAERLRRLNG